MHTHKHTLNTYLIQVQHLVAAGGLDVLHGQGEEDAPDVGEVQVVGIILVSLLHRPANTWCSSVLKIWRSW